MAQFVQLQGSLKDFHDAGIGVVALTYDAPEPQQSFVDENDIGYPFLSDIDATSVQALKILNEQYQPGDGAYGVPYPGIFIVDKNKTIVGKIFVEGYRTRVEAESVLATAKAVLN
jgi:peroxiredoxin